MEAFDKSYIDISSVSFAHF